MRQTIRLSDIETCKAIIKNVLREYNCELMDGDEGNHVLLRDKDTGATANAIIES